MKKRVFLLVLLFLFAIQLISVASEEEAELDLMLERVTDYIELNLDSVKFLFKTNPDVEVQFFLGEDSKKLPLVKKIKNYQSKEGLLINGLTPGKTYYYRIQAKRGWESKKTPVLSFTKLKRENTDLIAEWARTSVFYEIFIRSFADGNGDGIGDLKGLKDKISYIKSLGVKGVWLMPCFDSPSYHGYDVVDYYKIEPDYGTIEDFQNFLAEARRNGLKVIIDLVVNHTSTRHPWFVEASSSVDNKYRNYYIWASPLDNITEKGPWKQPKIWYNSNDYYYNALFASNMPDVNMRNPEVREEYKKIAKFWLDPNGDGNLDDGVDGFRLDAAMHIDHNSMEVTHNWWQEFNAYVKSINKDAFLVGENWTQPEKIAPFFKDMDASFNFDLAGPLIDTARGRSIAKGMDILLTIEDFHGYYRKYSDKFIDATFLSNHDQDRVGSRLNGKVENKKLAASLLLTLPGTPFIYYGEELGQLGKKPDDHIREPFDWYAAGNGPGMTNMNKRSRKAVYTLPNDGISVEEQDKDPNSLLNHYRKLIKIRNENPILFTGKYQRIKTSESVYGYKIEGGTNPIIVIHNWEPTDTTVSVNPGATELYSGKKITGSSVTIPPLGTVILKY